MRNAAIELAGNGYLAGGRVTFSPMPAWQLSMAYQELDGAYLGTQFISQLGASWWFAQHFAVSVYYQDLDYGGSETDPGAAYYFIDAQTGLSLSAYF